MKQRACAEHRVGRCVRRRAGRTAAGSSRSTSIPNQPAKAVGCRFTTGRRGCGRRCSHDSDLEQQRFADSSRHAVGGTDDVGHARRTNEQRQQRHEARNRPGDAEVEQDAPVREMLAEYDDRAERAGQRAAARAGRRAATHPRCASGKRGSGRTRERQDDEDRHAVPEPRPQRQDAIQHQRRRGRAEVVQEVE